jgi:hypothetical protein
MSRINGAKNPKFLITKKTVNMEMDPKAVNEAVDRQAVRVQALSCIKCKVFPFLKIYLVLSMELC